MNRIMHTREKTETLKRELELASEQLCSTWETGTLTATDLDLMEAKFQRLNEETGEAECLWLLSEIQIYRSRLIRREGAEIARQGLKQAPELTGLHDNYVMCAEGVSPHFHRTNHHRLIAEYRKMLQQHPSLLIARRILIEHLIADYRLDEALIEIEQARPHAGTQAYILEFYTGEIAYRRGQQEVAVRIWTRVCEEYPNDAMCLFLLGEQYAKFARYGEAAEAYERSFVLQQAPRRIDALNALVHIYEIIGDDCMLLHTVGRILNVFAQDYGITAGSEVDTYRQQKRMLGAKQTWS
ncbi:hypothetical protein B9G55_22610 [Saccharibacillus sp. O16]|nr:hypothetical protein B9G55_22610 [Saccharibacillus sp. O16]